MHSFGQEQIPIPAIAAAPGGSSGQAQTLAGQSISTLLGAANPCAKVKHHALTRINKTDTKLAYTSRLDSL